MQQRTRPCFLEAHDPEEHLYFEGSEAVPVDILARDDTTGGVKSPVYAACGEVNRWAEGDEANVW
jgi:hypothetical protein